MEPAPIFRWLQWLIQSFLLLLPKVSQSRYVIEKYLAYLKVWYYLSYTGVGKGDYLEFGVYEGASFALAMQSAKKYFKKGSAVSPRFFAFDSFLGLPRRHPFRDSGRWKEGAFRAEMDLFKKNIQKPSKGWEVIIVPGFYDTTLNAKVIESFNLKSASFVTIDCDIYDSTLAALRFIVPLLKTGSVIYFDDWYTSGGNMKLGEPGACADWLSENPKIKLVDFGNVQILGKLFIVNLENG